MKNRRSGLWVSYVRCAWAGYDPQGSKLRLKSRPQTWCRIEALSLSLDVIYVPWSPSPFPSPASPVLLVRDMKLLNDSQAPFWARRKYITEGYRPFLSFWQSTMSVIMMHNEAGGWFCSSLRVCLCHCIAFRTALLSLLTFFAGLGAIKIQTMNIWTHGVPAFLMVRLIGFFCKAWASLDWGDEPEQFLYLLVISCIIDREGSPILPKKHIQLQRLRLSVMQI